MTRLLIVDRLPSTFTVQQLKEIVEPFGKVASAQIIKDHMGQSLSFGYVEMENPDICAKVCRALNGRKINDHTIRVEVSSAQPQGS